MIGDFRLSIGERRSWIKEHEVESGESRAAIPPSLFAHIDPERVVQGRYSSSKVATS